MMRDFEKIEQLLQAKSFEELNDAEKALMEQYYRPFQYQAARQLLQNTEKESLKERSIAIVSRKKELLKAFHAQKYKSIEPFWSQFRSWFNYPVPVWQPVIVAAIGLILWVILGGTSSELPEGAANRPTVFLKDTIYITKEVVVEKILEDPSSIPRKQSIHVNTSTPTKEETGEELTVSIEKTQTAQKTKLSNSNIGRNIKQDPQLMDVLVETY